MRTRHLVLATIVLLALVASACIRSHEERERKDMDILSQPAEAAFPTRHYVGEATRTHLTFTFVSYQETLPLIGKRRILVRVGTDGGSLSALAPINMTFTAGQEVSVVWLSDYRHSATTRPTNMLFVYEEMEARRTAIDPDPEKIFPISTYEGRPIELVCNTETGGVVLRLSAARPEESYSNDLLPPLVDQVLNIVERGEEGFPLGDTGYTLKFMGEYPIWGPHVSMEGPGNGKQCLFFAEGATFSSEYQITAYGRGTKPPYSMYYDE